MESQSSISIIRDIIIPLISVVTAVMVGWLNYSVSKGDQELQQRINNVDLAIKEARDEREKLQAERDFSFRIYELVLQSLEARDEQKQEVARQFVLVMVDGELRKGLLGVLEAGGTEKVRKETSALIAKERTFNIQQREIIQPKLRQEELFNWEDWDYDIFWCTSSGDMARQQAEMIKAQLLQENAKGRIRVRELPDSVNAKSGYNIQGYVIRRSNDESTQAEALSKMAESTLAKQGFPATFDLQPTSTKTKWYISAFVCP